MRELRLHAAHTWTGPTSTRRTSTGRRSRARRWRTPRSSTPPAADRERGRTRWASGGGGAVRTTSPGRSRVAGRSRVRQRRPVPERYRRRRRPGGCAGQDGAPGSHRRSRSVRRRPIMTAPSTSPCSAGNGTAGYSDGGPRAGRQAGRRSTRRATWPTTRPPVTPWWPTPPTGWSDASPRCRARRRTSRSWPARRRSPAAPAADRRAAQAHPAPSRRGAGHAHVDRPDRGGHHDGRVGSRPIGVADRGSHIVFTTTGANTPQPLAGTGSGVRRAD